MSRSTGPDEAGFRRLHARTSTRLYGYVRRYCLEADCDDVIAEVYLVAWRRWDELPAEPMPWLLGTARRTIANHWRSRDRRERLAAELRGVQQLAAPDPANQAIERTDLLRALAELNPDDREILLLVGWDGLTSAEAGAVLGVSAMAARARLSRARHRLTDLVNEPSPTAELHSTLLPEGH